MRQSVEEGAAQLLGLDPGFWSKVGRGGQKIASRLPPSAALHFA